LELNRDLRQLMSREELVDGQGRLEVWLRGQTETRLQVEVTAHDAKPTATMEVPAEVRVGESLRLAPSVSDDVAVERVEFFFEGHRVGVRQTAPFELSLDIAEHLVGQTVEVSAEAFDAKEQSDRTSLHRVRVQSAHAQILDQVGLETPDVGQHVVAGGSLIVRGSVVLEGASVATGTDFMDVRLDGASVARFGQRRFVEQCPAPGFCVFKEVWEGRIAVPTTVGQRMLRMVPCTYNHCEEEFSAQRSIEVVPNRGPTVRIVSPTTRTEIAQGQLLAVEVEFSDDTLAEGTSVELLREDTVEVLDRYNYANRLEFTRNAQALETGRHTFVWRVQGVEPGDTLRLMARVRDDHQVEANSNGVVLTVRGDQPPVVSISSPAQGSSHVSGAPMEIRVDARDDLGVQRVDFFVDGQMVGSDAVAPYALVHTTRAGVLQAQTMRLTATAVDSAGQESESAAVDVLLGPDDQQPVVNLVSPEIVRLDPVVGELAEAIENTSVLLRVSGYDNVGVVSLEIDGVCRGAAGFELVGVGGACDDPEQTPEALGEPFFRPEPIPGPLHGFTGIL
ncbi:MAG: Ig-like domain-containing protein, partial [Myxococcota bacterium]